MVTEQYAVTAEFYDYVVPYQARQDVAAPSASFMPSRCATSSATKLSTCWRAAGLPWRRYTPITTRVHMDRNIRGS